MKTNNCKPYYKIVLFKWKTIFYFNNCISKTKQIYYCNWQIFYLIDFEYKKKVQDFKRKRSPNKRNK